MIAYHATTAELRPGARLRPRRERPIRYEHVMLPDRRGIPRLTRVGGSCLSLVHPQLEVVSATYVTATPEAAWEWSTMMRSRRGVWRVYRVWMPPETPIEVHGPGSWTCDAPDETWAAGVAADLPRLWRWGQQAAEVRVYGQPVVLGPL